MNSIREDYIQEAMEAEKRRSTSMRWVALAACVALVFGIGVGSLFLSVNKHSDTILPPARFGAYSDGKMSLAKSFTLESAYDEADVVAWVRVGNWLGERTGEKILDATYFEVEVVKAFKGNPGDSIVMEQLGSSAWTIKGYPLFTFGNELLVFLVEAEGREYENCYYINGTYSTVMDVVTNTDGKTYVADRFGMLGDSAVSHAIDILALLELKVNLSDVLKDVDTIQQAIVEGSEYIFIMETIEDLFTQ